ncbi:MAG: hypothetical protein RLZZ131_356 [Actinomycetota bacterium]
MSETNPYNKKDERKAREFISPSDLTLLPGMTAIGVYGSITTMA